MNVQCNLWRKQTMNLFVTNQILIYKFVVWAKYICVCFLEDFFKTFVFSRKHSTLLVCLFIQFALTNFHFTCVLFLRRLINLRKRHEMYNASLNAKTIIVCSVKLLQIYLSCLCKTKWADRCGKGSHTQVMNFFVNKF